MRPLFCTLLILFAGCTSPRPELPPLEGPQPLTAPRPPAPPALQWSVTFQDVTYGQTRELWLTAWAQGRVIWERPAPALDRPVLALEDVLITAGWNRKLSLWDRPTGDLLWSVVVPGLESVRLSADEKFVRCQGLDGHLRLYDRVDGQLVYNRPGFTTFPAPRPGQWRASDPWFAFSAPVPGPEPLHRALALAPPPSPPTQPASDPLPPVPVELVRWLTQQDRDPSLLRFWPPGELQTALASAPQDSFILFTAWKPGVYTFSSPGVETLPVVISLKDFAGAEMDSTMGYGNLLPSVRWKMKRGEPVLLQVSFLNPDHAGQGVLLQVDIN